MSAIAAVLAALGSPAYTSALQLQSHVLTDQLHTARGRLELLDQLLDQEGRSMNAITVTHTTVPARTVVALRGTVPTYQTKADCGPGSFRSWRPRG